MLTQHIAGRGLSSFVLLVASHAHMHNCQLLSVSASTCNRLHCRPACSGRCWQQMQQKPVCWKPCWQQQLLTRAPQLCVREPAASWRCVWQRLPYVASWGSYKVSAGVLADVPICHKHSCPRHLASTPAKPFIWNTDASARGNTFAGHQALMARPKQSLHVTCSCLFRWLQVLSKRWWIC
jgi:hypothetical protein